jgi:hypothetical protein
VGLALDAESRPHFFRSELREIVEEAAEIEVPRLEKNLEPLVGIAHTKVSHNPVYRTTARGDVSNRVARPAAHERVDG